MPSPLRSRSDQTTVGGLSGARRLLWLTGRACMLQLPTLWAIAALYFDVPTSWLRPWLAVGYALAMLAVWIFIKRGLIATNLPLAELKERGHINERARAAGRAVDFSRLIREGVPGTEL
jgi:hypothetical protein